MSDEHAPYPDGHIINGLYEVITHFPPGGMGLVAKVKQLSDGQVVALKYCRSKDALSKKRFAREVRVMARIGHPHVMPVLRKGLKHDPPYFTMELAKHSVEDELTATAGDESIALAVFQEACAGIQAIHNAGAVHRDVKPANFLRMTDDRIVVADLGVAKFVERDTTILTQARAMVGTDMYAAPEQKLPDGSIDADVRTDVYQLGKTLYQLLTGRKPVLMDLNKVPSGLAHVIKRATREKPDDRYQSVAQLLDAIALYRRGKDPAARPADAYRSLLAVVEDRVAKGRFKQDELEQLVQLLLAINTDEHNLYLDLFDELPPDVLRVAASQLQHEFEPVLRRYTEAVNAVIREQNFSYAERVAKNVEIVVHGSEDNDLRVMAMQALLIAAVDLNRFAAMQTFDELLIEATDDGYAMALAEMLGSQRVRYATLADRVPASKLHPALRETRALVLQEPSSSSATNDPSSLHKRHVVAVNRLRERGAG